MASMSKRQQARNERDLHDLLRVAGNNRCADCGASNPGWASWSLGIFVCMRCASLHRKLGTHISKVKSLSMDTWSVEQVENMKRNGNTAVNQAYNPKNRRPDMPTDADEIDSAMERFIRKKYQDRSLLQDNTRPAVRNEGSPPVPPKSPTEPSPVLPAPAKKSRFFGFGLRASSSAYPLSKHDKKKLPPEPRVESAFTFSSDDYGSLPRSSKTRAPISDAEMQRKQTQLKDMGFSDTDQNAMMLRRLNGNLERTVETLVQLGPSVGQRTSSTKVTSNFTSSSEANKPPSRSSDSAWPETKVSTSSNNPFDQTAKGQGFGLSVAPPQQPQLTRMSNNPFDQPARSQTDSGLSNAFQGLQLSQQPPQPLFPHSTGGYSVQQPPTANPRMQSMTPPAPKPSQQYGYVSSPPALLGHTNPFFQQIQPQNTGSNPFFQQQQQQQQQQLQQQYSGNMATNPFFSANNVAQQSNSVAPSINPFGLPPSKGSSPPGSSQAQVGQLTGQVFNPAYGSGPTSVPPNNPFLQQAPQQLQAQTSPQFSNFQYGQPSVQQSQQPQPQPSMQAPSQFQMASGANSSFAQAQNTQQYAQQFQTTPLMPQQTGLYDKSSILALYNYPQLAPAKPRGLSSIPEPTNGSGTGQADMMHPARRSATMPISMGSMHSAGGAGNMGASRNPFFQTPNPQQQMAGGQGSGILAKHGSQESVSVNNLDNGRHSPDAFANLSARYGS